MDSRTYKKLNRLVSFLFDGQLDEAGREELRQMLAADREAREAYGEMVATEVLSEKRYIPALCPTGEFAADEMPTLDSLQVEPPICCASPYQPATPSPTLRNRWLRPLVVLAASLLLVVEGGAWWNEALWHRTPAVGVLTKTVNAVWADPQRHNLPMQVAVGEQVDLKAGLAEITMNSGVVVAMRGPAKIRCESPMRISASRGTVRARVGEDALGFVIATPTTEVVDLGTDFGVEVDDSSGSTSVVVFEGMVDLQYRGDEAHSPSGRTATSRRPKLSNDYVRLHGGEALQVDSAGGLSRIMAVHSEHFPVAAVASPRKTTPCLIRSVSDNVRDPAMAQYYQIVHGGFGEDCRAYVDRYHEWNGIDADGVPDFLLDGVSVWWFYADKWQADFELSIDLAEPVQLFVLYDERLPVPDWLAHRFENTGLRIGVDEGYRRSVMKQVVGRGAGQSVDTFYSIWEMQVVQPQVVTLGALPLQVEGVSMYGVVAVPLPLASAEHAKPLELFSAQFPNPRPRLLKATSPPALGWPAALVE